MRIGTLAPGCVNPASDCGFLSSCLSLQTEITENRSQNQVTSQVSSEKNQNVLPLLCPAHMTDPPRVQLPITTFHTVLNPRVSESMQQEQEVDKSPRLQYECQGTPWSNVSPLKVKAAKFKCT